MTDSSMTDSSMTDSSMTGSGSAGSGGASASVVPAQLDAQTTTWFETFCGGVSPIVQEAQGINSSGDPAAAQQAGVTLFQKMGAAFTDTSAKLAATPPPTFDGGADVAAKLAAGLSESGSTVSAFATKFAAINPSDTAAMQQATADLTTQLTEAFKPVQSLSELDPSIGAAAQQIPACQALGG